MNKKGISAVVATVLIILITVAAVTIIWSAVIPMIKNNLIGSDDCMKAQAEVSIGSEGFSCLNVSGEKISLQIAHGPSSFILDGLQVIVSVGGNSYQKEFTNTELPTTSNSEKILTITESSLTGYNASTQNLSDATKVQIAPIIRSGNVRKPCGISQTLSPIPVCS